MNADSLLMVLADLNVGGVGIAEKLHMLDKCAVLLHLAG